MQDQKGCKKNILGDEEQITAALTKHEDGEEYTGIRWARREKQGNRDTNTANNKQKTSTQDSCLPILYISFPFIFFYFVIFFFCLPFSFSVSRNSWLA